MAANWLAARAAERDALLEQALELLQADPRVAGAWLLGSLGRGTADAWSDVDLCIVVRDEAAATFVAERRELVARVAPPLLIQEVPRNAPPDGGYLLVLYPGSRGPLHVDWYLRPRAGAVVPRDARLLFDRVGLQVAAPPAPQDRADAALRDVLFFWAMAPIAAKYVGRGWPGASFDLLRMMAGALNRVRGALAAPAPTGEAMGEPWLGLLTADLLEQLATLRRLCREMEQLLPRIGALDGPAGRLTPDALPEIDHLLDAVQTLVQSEVTPPEGPKQGV